MSLSTLSKKQIAVTIGEECEKAESTAEYLLHAPEACCIIEALAILAASFKKDASLKSGDKNEKFVYLRTPDSFRASLYQVINAMGAAFRTAHNSMDKIQLTLAGMSGLMADSLDAMNHLDETDAHDILESSLSAIKESANTCMKAAQVADDGCTESMEVIKELLQAALATQGRSEQRVAVAEIERKEHEIRKAQKEIQKKELEELMEEQKKIVEEAKEDYRNRMKQSEQFTGIVAAMFIDNLNSLVMSLGKATVNVTSLAETLPKSALEVFKYNINAFKKEDLISQAMEGVLFELLEDMIGIPYEEIVTNVDVHINNLKCINICKTSETGKILRKAGKNINESLESIRRHEANCQNKFNAAKNATQIMLKAYEKTQEQAEEKTDTSADARSMSSEERQTMMRTRIQNLGISKNTMTAECEKQERLRKEKITAAEELAEIMTNLARLELEEVDLTNTLVYLQQGINELKNVQIAWNNIVSFFDNIKNVVDESLIFQIKGMASNVESSIANDATNVSCYKRGIICRHITQACAVVNILMQSAELYKNISKNHVMPVINNSITNIGMTQREAQFRQSEILANFNTVREEVQSTIHTFTKNLKNKVYDSMEEQGFDVHREIEDKNNKHKYLH